MKYIHLSNIEFISRGDDTRVMEYLVQFKELIPELSVRLEKALSNKDRIQIRQILHKMSPQLQFFGITDLVEPIQRLEYEYDSIALAELEDLVRNVITILNRSLDEVSHVIDQKQNNPIK
ncbi:Hpt domain-containing protein [Zeaxanthinibacter enoshimensis]|uniref:Hpt domain-containing protein n=1 Tax=Zeaxanthinibacter enoshimensis TaxID=392009 RepID=UPI003569C3EE